MTEYFLAFWVMWCLIVTTWMIGAFAAVLIIRKFRQHSDTIRDLRKAHDIQEQYVNGMLERMTRPAPPVPMRKVM